MALNLRKVGQVAKGLSQGLMNYRNISLANEKLSRDREDYETNKKISNLKLKQAERDTSKEQYDVLKRKQKLAQDTAELDFDVKEQKVAQAKNKTEVEVKKGLYLKDYIDRQMGSAEDSYFRKDSLNYNPMTGKFTKKKAPTRAEKKEIAQEKLLAEPVDVGIRKPIGEKSFLDKALQSFVPPGRKLPVDQEAEATFSRLDEYKNKFKSVGDVFDYMKSDDLDEDILKFIDESVFPNMTGKDMEYFEKEVLPSLPQYKIDQLIKAGFLEDEEE